MAFCIWFMLSKDLLLYVSGYVLRIHVWYRPKSIVQHFLFCKLLKWFGLSMEIRFFIIQFSKTSEIKTYGKSWLLFLSGAIFSFFCTVDLYVLEPLSFILCVSKVISIKSIIKIIMRNYKQETKLQYNLILILLKLSFQIKSFQHQPQILTTIIKSKEKQIKVIWYKKRILTKDWAMLWTMVLFVSNKKVKTIK